MEIDLTKFIYNNLYKLPIDSYMEVPGEFLNNTDIRRISLVKISGFIADNEEQYELNIVVSGEMVLPCARTLKDVSYPFNIEINEIIGENSENTVQIVQNRVDIFPIIWQYILMDVPLRILAPDAKEEPLKGDGWRLITEDEQKEAIDPRLAKLKDFIKE